MSNTKIIWHKIEMPRTKNIPHGPQPDNTPPPPPSLPADSEFTPLDEQALLKAIPESVVTFKPGPPPKKSPGKQQQQQQQQQSVKR